MNKLSTLVIGGSLFLAVSTSFAASKTDLNNNWTCTTNASKADTSAGQAADDRLAKNQTSAVSAFANAASNCRDCTKIICEVK